MPSSRNDSAQSGGLDPVIEAQLLLGKIPEHDAILDLSDSATWSITDAGSEPLLYDESKAHCPICAEQFTKIAEHAFICNACAITLDLVPGKQRSWIIKGRRDRVAKNEFIAGLQCPHCPSNNLQYLYPARSRGDDKKANLYWCRNCLHLVVGDSRQIPSSLEWIRGKVNCPLCKSGGIEFDVGFRDCEAKCRCLRCKYKFTVNVPAILESGVHGKRLCTYCGNDTWFILQSNLYKLELSYQLQCAKCRADELITYKGKKEVFDVIYYPPKTPWPVLKSGQNARNIRHP